MAPTPSAPTMMAWSVPRLGRPLDVLELTEVPQPVPGPGQIAVRTRACALAFPDVLMCRAGYQLQPDLPFIAGSEVLGEIVALGPGVDLTHRGLALGSAVTGVGTQIRGGLAEVTLVDAAAAVPAAQSLELAEATALFGAYLTGWLALHRRARLQAGEVLLVHAAAGGAGSAAVQLGLVGGATVIGVTSGGAKADAVRQLGADYVIDRTSEDVIEAVKDITGGRGVDVAFDPVGGSAWSQSTKLVAFEGRLLVIGFASGEIHSQALNHPLVKTYSIVGLNTGTYVMKYPELAVEAYGHVLDLAERGAIKPMIGARVPFGQAAQSLQDLDDGKTIGRHVVLVAP